MVKSMDHNSSSGPDGFHGKFDIHCWNIIKNDLLQAVLAFFSGNQLPIAWTSTTIVTIPKVQAPTSLNHLRPIYLCNFCMKIISKMLNNRMCEVLPDILSKNQSGFIQGRNIHDNVLLSQEMAQFLDRGNTRILKLAMEKAYDRMSWFFMTKVLRQFGFSEFIIDMIWRLLSNNSYSVLRNGKPEVQVF